jgi:hypothetical protein
MTTKSLDQSEQVHKYNNPQLSPLEFLLEIMHDRDLPMRTRILAATYALPLTEPPAGVRRVADLTIKVPALQ